MTIELLNYDCFLLIVRNLDAASMINLIMTCSRITHIYKSDAEYINDLIIYKMLDELNLQSIYKKISKHPDKKIIYTQIIKLYYFSYKNAFYSQISYINFLVLQSSESSMFLLNELLDKNRNNILEYNYETWLLSCENMEKIDCIINKAPLSPISFCFILKKLAESNYNHDNLKFEKYLYHALGKFDTYQSESVHLYLQEILLLLVNNSKIGLLNIFLDSINTYNVTVDYNAGINTAIEIDNLEILKLLFTEHNNFSYDGERYIIVRDSSLKRLIANTKLNCLDYILSNMIGSFVNCQKYMTAICEGLSTYLLVQSSEKINHIKLRSLFEYLNIKNKVRINNYLHLIYKN